MLRLSNCWEYHPHTHHHTNSKLHDRAEIEQNSENKSYQSILGDPKTIRIYLSPEVKNPKSKGTLFSSTLKVGENKVVFDF